MRRILMSLMVIAVAVLAVVGGTFAKFADTTTSVENKFTAGNVSISVNGDDSETVAAIFAPENIKPGDTGTAFIHLKNVGSVTGCLFEMEADGPSSQALASKINVVIWEDSNNNSTQDSGEDPLYNGTLTHLKSLKTSEKIISAQADETHFVFTWTFEDTDDKQYMNANCSVYLKFIARQP